MKPLLITLAQTNSAAIILMIVLLIGAAAIGYLTAWFYAKSVYTPVIKNLEEEKEELIRKLADLKDDVKKLSTKIEKLNEKNDKLEEEIKEKDKEIKQLKKKQDKK